MAYTYAPSNITEKQRMSLSTWALQFSHGLHNIVSLFATTFLVSYIMHVNVEDSIGKSVTSIALYYLSLYFAMLVFNTILSIFVDRTNRVGFYRFGVIFKGVFVGLIIFLGRDLAIYAPLAGAIFGLSESFYYSSFNVMKSEVIPRAHADKFVVWQNIFTKFINVVFPIILGALIDALTFTDVAFCVLGIVAIQLILTFFIKSQRPDASSFNLIKYIKKLCTDKGEGTSRLKNYYRWAIVYGGTTIHTALASLLAIYTFKTNLNLGLFTALFAFLAIVTMLIFKKTAKMGGRKWWYIVLGILAPAISIAVAISINKVTYILFDCILTVFVCVIGYGADVHRTIIPKRTGNYEYIAEHQALCEVLFNTTRCVTFGLMLVLGLTLDLLGLKILIGVLSVFYPLLSILLYKLESVESRYPISEQCAPVAEIKGGNNEN